MSENPTELVAIREEVDLKAFPIPSDTETPKEKKKKRPEKILVNLANTKGVIDIMQCSLCQKIPESSKMLCCKKGHLICISCTQVIPADKCPAIKKTETEMGLKDKSCNEGIKEYKSLLYEYFYNNSKFPCTYSAIGCLKPILGKDLIVHQRRCRYRPILPCPFSNCPGGGRLGPGILLCHLVDFHGVMIMENDGCRVKIARQNHIQPKRVSSKVRANAGDGAQGVKKYPSKCRSVCGIFKCYNQIFMLMVEELEEDICIWVSLHSDPKKLKGKTFKSILTLVSVTNDQHKVTLVEDIHPFKASDKIIEDGAILLVVKNTLVKKYMYKEGNRMFWNVDVKIMEHVPEMDPVYLGEPFLEEDEVKIGMDNHGPVPEVGVQGTAGNSLSSDGEWEMETESEDDMEPKPDSEHQPESGLELKPEPELESDLQPKSDSEPKTETDSEQKSDLEPKSDPEPHSFYLVLDELSD